MTPQSLLQQYLGGLNIDNRTFGTDVMGYDQYFQPVDAVMRQLYSTVARPEFLQYQYNPAANQALNTLQQSNQNIGLSGAWMSGRARQGLQDQATDAQRSLDYASRQFDTDFVNNTVDYYRRMYGDKYNTEMSNFYTSNLREFGGSPAVNPGQTNYSPGGVAGNTAIETPMGNPYYQTANKYDSLIGSYMGMPKASGQSPYDRLI